MLLHEQYFLLASQLIQLEPELLDHLGLVEDAGFTLGERLFLLSDEALSRIDRFYSLLFTELELLEFILHFAELVLLLSFLVLVLTP